MLAMYAGSPLATLEDPRAARQRSRRIALRESQLFSDEATSGRTQEHGLIDRMRSMLGHRSDDRCDD